MLRIPTFVAPSRISGMGLFTAVDLSAETIVWEFDERVDWAISPEEFDAFPEPYRSRMGHYVYLDDSGLYIFCGDNAKFMNHEDEPNCADPDGEYTITRQPIKAGEELTCDYKAFDIESKQNGLDFKAGAADSRLPGGTP